MSSSGGAMQAEVAVHGSLMAALEAVSSKERAAAVALLGAAADGLPVGRWHKSRPDIAEAVAAVEAGEWDRAWRKVHHALCGLTWMFPPDPSVCPPLPSARNTRAACVGCGGALTVRSVFCAGCGSPVAGAGA